MLNNKGNPNGANQQQEGQEEEGQEGQPENISKQYDVESIVSQFEKMKLDIYDRMQDLKKDKYIKSANYTTMKKILDRCTKSASIAKKLLEQADYKALDAEIWRCNVDLQSLYDML